MSRKIGLLVPVILAVLVVWMAVLGWGCRGRVTDVPSPATLPAAPSPPAVTPSAEVAENATGTIEAPPVIPAAEPVVALARKLEIPWSLAFLPDGSIIFTERPGRVRLVDSAGKLLAEPLLTIDEVFHRGEGGLLGIAVHPDFNKNQFIYVYYTYQGQAGPANKVVRFKLEGRRLTDKQTILDGIPAAGNHNGGRIKFGLDGYLYITAGDAARPELAQDKGSLAGKIFRVKDDGSIPPDNPFPGSPVYSYGHRNPQGLAWDSQGRLWETEHGSTTRDELNLIQPGKNYGWPEIRGDEAAEGMEGPALHSGDDTWAPSGLAFYPSASSGQAEGSLYFAGLRGQTLYQVVFSGERVTLIRHLSGDYGRLRDVVVGPDGFLYVLTSNRDGRTIPTGNDDLLLRIDPTRLR